MNHAPLVADPLLVILAASMLLALGAGSAIASGNTVKATSGNAWSPAKTAVTRGSKVTWSNPTYQTIRSSPTAATGRSASPFCTAGV